MLNKLGYRFRLLLGATVIFLSSSASASAISVVPMVLDFSPIGSSANQSFKVVNDGTTPLPIEILISKLELGLDGEQNMRPAGEEFLIYPAQAMVPAGGSQVFRVQWIGDPDIGKSQTYRFNVSQVPVKLPKNTSGIQIVMSFGVTVNVAPPNASSDIVVLDAAPTAKDGKRLASVRVRNPGNSHAYLSKSSVRVAGKGWSAEMGAGDIAQKVGLGIVQPGKERRFILPVEVPANISAIEATVKLQPGG